MRTRSEQVQAYRFVTRRIVSALLSGEPETTDRPMRRFGMSIFGSSMIAAIVFAGMGVYGFINKGGGKPEDNAIIVERETGARYVYRNQRLHPVLNFTSARLVVGAPTPKIQNLSHKSLRGVQRGRPVGIPNAPDTLPDKASLAGLPWSVCSTPRELDSAAIASQVLVGRAPAGGTPLGDQAVLVTLGNTRYLLWNDTRMRVRGTDPLAALELTRISPIPVGEALLNSITAGPDLIAPTIRDRGKPSGKQIGGEDAAIGSVYRTESQHYVLLADGLTPVGEVTAKLVSPVTGGIRAISASEASRVLSATTRIEPDRFPARLPPVREAPAEMVCTTFQNTADRAENPLAVQIYDRVDERLLVGLDETQNPGTGRDGIRLAHRTLVEGGRGALVRELPAPNAPTAQTTMYLITDQGIRYALAPSQTMDVAAVLGYEGVAPVPIPKNMLALIPTGPTLDPEAAQRFVGTPAPAATPSPTPAGSARPSPNPSR